MSSITLSIRHKNKNFIVELKNIKKSDTIEQVKIKYEDLEGTSPANQKYFRCINPDKQGNILTAKTVSYQLWISCWTCSHFIDGEELSNDSTVEELGLEHNDLLEFQWFDLNSDESDD